VNFAVKNHVEERTQETPALPYGAQSTGRVKHKVSWFVNSIHVVCTHAAGMLVQCTWLGAVLCSVVLCCEKRSLLCTCCLLSRPVRFLWTS